MRTFIRASISCLLIAGLGLTQLRVSTRLVQVNVVVQSDKRAGENLTADDFELFDQGKRQRIAVFTTGAGKDAAQAPAKLPPRVFSNRYGQKVKGASIILLDLLNSPPSRHEQARMQVIQALQKMDGEYAVALYALDGRLRILHDFSQDTAHLKETLAAYRGSSPVSRQLSGGDGGLSPNAATAGTPLNQMAVESNQLLGANYALKRTEITLAALEAIAKHVKEMPGRKNLVWISSSFPMTVLTPGRLSIRNEEPVHRVGRLLNDADVAIYPIHDGGLVTTGSTAQGEQSARAVRVSRAGSMVGPANDPVMATVAEDSGGRAFYNVNDLAGALKQAIQDSETSYSLGFYPSDSSMDGRFHQLRVQVKVKGVKLRHRRGYYAVEEDISSEAHRTAELNAVGSSPFASAAVGLSVRVDPSNEPKPGSLRFIVGIDVAMLELEQNNGKRNGGVQLTIVQQASDGRALDSASDNVLLGLEPADYQRLAKDGLVLQKIIPPVEGAFQARVLVMDRMSGRIGSVLVPGIRELAAKP